MIRPRTLFLHVVLLLCSIATARAEDVGRHDMLLLLPDGPIHLRIDVTDAGKPLAKLRSEFLERLKVILDSDNDGKIGRKETTKHPLFVSGRRFEDNEFLNSLRSQKDYTDKELNLAVARAAGQLVSFRQNNSLTDQDLSVFRVLDENESGLIERFEMRSAAARLAQRDADFDQCVTFDEFMNQPSLDMMNMVVAATNLEPPGSVHSELLRDAMEPILAARLVRRYDADRDAKLSAKELGWTIHACEVLDADRDQLLSVQELAGLIKGEPALWLAIDLSIEDAKAMRILGGRLADEMSQTHAGLVKTTRQGMTLSIGYRYRNLQQEAERNALQALNAIDIDSNGYLDREEIFEHQRFERYLFDAMDGNDDDRVFADELLTYVRAYTEPTSTSCQVTLFDTGNGYFQMLDKNSDGRISIRELRSTEANLLKVSNSEQVINPSRLTKSYRIEIQRGGIGLFGRVDRLGVDAPTAQLQSSVGPIWFQRMDRNSDGDLVWDEFLGPREVFHRLDRDQDGLVSADEAEAYTK